jgi:hypothetical protein
MATVTDGLLGSSVLTSLPPRWFHSLEGWFYKRLIPIRIQNATFVGCVVISSTYFICLSGASSVPPWYHLEYKMECNYSAAIHQDGGKPVLFVPFFFRELLGFLPNWRKLGLKASDSLPVLSQKAFESLIRKKNKCHFTKGPFFH